MNTGIEISSLTSELEQIRDSLQLIESTEEVQKYLKLISSAKEFEESIRVHVAESGDKVTYYSIEDKSFVKISPCLKENFKPDVDKVRELFDGKFLQESVNLPAMKVSPECTEYLESIKTTTKYATKRKIDINKIDIF